MPFVITPGQLVRRSELYHQLGQLTSAGLGLIPALEQIRRHPPSRSFRQPLDRLLNELHNGETFADSLRRIGDWMPIFDIALLEAGERSGRLDACLRVLSNYYSDRARMARQMIGAMLYPIFLFHFAIFIFPFATFFTTGDWITYLKQTIGVLIPVYVVVILLIYAAQGSRGEAWRSFMEMVLHPIPVLGSGRRALALSRLSTALEALISAGVNIIQAWQLAAEVSGSPAFRRAERAWHRNVVEGQLPSEAVAASGVFPDLFTNQYAAGEISGKLDDVLRRMRDYYQEEGTRKIHAVAQWTPRAVYLVIALMIAYRVIHFWMGYFQQIQNVTNGF